MAYLRSPGEAITIIGIFCKQTARAPTLYTFSYLRHLITTAGSFSPIYRTNSTINLFINIHRLYSLLLWNCQHENPAFDFKNSGTQNLCNLITTLLFWKLSVPWNP